GSESIEYADTAHALALLCARRERPRGSGAAEQRDELAPFHQQFLPCFEAEDSTAGDLLHCGISIGPMSAMGQKRRRPSLGVSRACPLCSRKRQCGSPSGSSVAYEEVCRVAPTAIVRLCLPLPCIHGQGEALCFAIKSMGGKNDVNAPVAFGWRAGRSGVGCARGARPGPRAGSADP